MAPFSFFSDKKNSLQTEILILVYNTAVDIGLVGNLVFSNAGWVLFC